MNAVTKKLSKIGAMALCVAGLGLTSIEPAQAFWGGWMSPWNWFGGRHWDYYNPYWGGGPYGWGSPYGYYQPWGYSPYSWGGHYPYYGGGYYPHYGYYPYSYAPPAAAPAPSSSSSKKD